MLRYKQFSIQQKRICVHECAKSNVSSGGTTFCRNYAMGSYLFYLLRVGGVQVIAFCLIWILICACSGGGYDEGESEQEFLARMRETYL
jgi:hypothetical protein